MRKQYHFWKSTTGNGLDAWDVDRLIELSADLEASELPVASIAEIDSVYWFDGDQHRPTVRAVVDHVRLIQQVDPSLPIILAPDGRVMDGMHRIARARSATSRSRAVVGGVIGGANRPPRVGQATAESQLMTFPRLAAAGLTASRMSFGWLRGASSSRPAWT